MIVLFGDGGCIFPGGIGAIGFVPVLKENCPVRVHGETGLLALNFAGIDRGVVFLAGDQDGVLVGKPFAGERDEIQYAKQDCYSDQEEQNDFLVWGQGFDF